MNLLEEKYELLNQMYDITKEALSFLSDTSFEDYDELEKSYEMLTKTLEKRSELIDCIDKLDEKLSQDGSESIDEAMKSNFEIVLSGINNLDDQIMEIIQGRFRELSSNLKEINDGRKGIDMTKYSDVQGLSFDISQ